MRVFLFNKGKDPDSLAPTSETIPKVPSCCNAAAKCVQQDGANVDLTISNTFRLAAVD